MKLKNGDIICDQCKGTGYPNNNKIDYESKSYFNSPHVCDKCNGDGKLDWIEAVIGKPKQFKVNWSTSDQLYGQDINSIVMDNLGKKLSKQIDKEILKGITNGTETW